MSAWRKSVKMFSPERLYGRAAILNTGYWLSLHFRLTTHEFQCVIPNVAWDRLNTENLNAQFVFT